MSTLVCTPYLGAESYLFIDPGSAGSFSIYDLFAFISTKPIFGRSLSRDYTGNAHVVDRYWKDTFTVNFPKLLAAQQYALQVLLQQTGTNALHTVIYGGNGPGGTLEVRKYDGTTQYASGYGINDDVQRLRRQVIAVDMEFPHWPGISNIFSGTVKFEEA